MCTCIKNHVEQAREQLSREPRPLPTLTLARSPDSILDYREADIVIDGMIHTLTSKLRWQSDENIANCCAR